MAHDVKLPAINSAPPRSQRNLRELEKKDKGREVRTNPGSASIRCDEGSKSFPPLMTQGQKPSTPRASTPTKSHPAPKKPSSSMEPNKQHSQSQFSQTILPLPAFNPPTAPFQQIPNYIPQTCSSDAPNGLPSHMQPPPMASSPLSAVVPYMPLYPLPAFPMFYPPTWGSMWPVPVQAHSHSAANYGRESRSTPIEAAEGDPSDSNLVTEFIPGEDYRALARQQYQQERRKLRILDERQELMQRLEDEQNHIKNEIDRLEAEASLRMKREDEGRRQRNNAARTIQRIFRGYLIRKQFTSLQVNDFNMMKQLDVYLLEKLMLEIIKE
ncbi:hypothetical protein HDU76_005998, partial [Blyttiomyces sp. JEL0837]